MKPSVGLMLLAIFLVAPMAEPASYVFDVTSGEVQVSIQLTGDPNVIDPNVLATDGGLSGTFTVTVDEGDDGVGAGDTFAMSDADLTNDDEMTIALIAVATATLSPGSARFLDFDFGDNDEGVLDQNGIGLVDTESYLEADIVITGLYNTTFSTQGWSDPITWTLSVDTPYHLLTVQVAEPGWGSVQTETVGSPTISASLSGTHHLETEIPEFSATLLADVAVDVEATSGVAPQFPHYPDGCQVRLTAVAESGYRFLRWEGDVPGGLSDENPLTIAMNADKDVSATFAEGMAVVAQADPDVIAPGGTSTLTASASGGTGPYTYQWNTGQTGSSIEVTPSQTTEYTVTARDSLDTEAVDSVTVTVASALSVAVQASPDFIAAGATSTLTATASGGVGPYTYQWSTGQSGLSIQVSPTETTKYTVTVRDDLDTEASGSATVTVAPPLVAAAQADPALITSGTTSNLTASASGGSAPYTFNWNTGQSGANISVSPTTTTEYTVTVTDAVSQTATAKTTVTVASGVTVSAQASPQRIASGQTATLTSSASGGVPPYSYDWSTGDAGANVSVSPTVTTTYVVTARDSLSQVAQANVVVTVASGLFATVQADPATVEPGQSSTLTATGSGGVAPYSYCWDTAQTTHSITVDPTETTTYAVTITDALDQAADGEATVTVQTTPVEPTYTLTVNVTGPGSVAQTPPGQTTFQSGESVTLTATPLEQCDGFLGWQGSVVSADAEITVVMDGDKTVTATFYDGRLAPSSCTGPGVCQIALTALAAVLFTRPARRRPRR